MRSLKILLPPPPPVHLGSTLELLCDPSELPVSLLTGFGAATKFKKIKIKKRRGASWNASSATRGAVGLTPGRAATGRAGGERTRRGVPGLRRTPARVGRDEPEEDPHPRGTGQAGTGNRNRRKQTAGKLGWGGGLPWHRCASGGRKGRRRTHSFFIVFRRSLGFVVVVVF